MFPFVFLTPPGLCGPCLRHLFGIDLRLEGQSKQVTAAAGSLTDEALTLVCAEVDEAYDCQKAIEAQLRRVQTLLKSQAHHVSLYQGVIEGLVSSLKELGDLSNWAQTLETLAKEVTDLADGTTAAIHESRDINRLRHR